ncbi:MAG TPA: aldo/keto reductase, partial [Ilumatobacteraceae bacterium]|nr:aldo/keto reductase [Ilumatobacteraceae bacterium]
MPYRRLGHSGLQLSALSFGSWVTFDTQVNDDLAIECMQTAWDAGCNFFDNAEAYAGGESEAIMGRAIEQLGWKRQSYVLSTKIFWGTDGDMVNMRNTLNRKYIHHAIEGCLDRLR